LTAYPFTTIHTQVDPDSTDSSNDDDGNNLRRIYHVLEMLLKWYPRQIDRFVERWPPLSTYSAHLLEETLAILLAELSEDEDNDAQPP
jgi:hypothetical protein